MSKLYVVRHGQASALGPTYDALSEVGTEQAARLGRYWAEAGLRFDRVFVGPRTRHRQTEQGVRAAYEERGVPIPVATAAEQLDEFPMLELARRGGPLVAASDPTARRWLEQMQQGGPAGMRAAGRLFTLVAKRYAEGDLRFDDMESFGAFRDRVEAFVRTQLQSLERGRTVVLFTSGGPVSAMVGFALGVDDRRTMDLVGMVRNASWAEFRFTPELFTLETFNVHPHLDDSQLVTHV